MLRSLGLLVVTVSAILGLTVAPAGAATTHTEAAEVTGAPALIIILVILALIVIGVVAVIRFVVRKGRDAL
jgi:TRAP-type C4-dicarboxylate transport system permease small subunit